MNKQINKIRTKKKKKRRRKAQESSRKDPTRQSKSRITETVYQSVGCLFLPALLMLLWTAVKAPWPIRRHRQAAGTAQQHTAPHIKQTALATPSACKASLPVWRLLTGRFTLTALVKLVVIIIKWPSPLSSLPPSVHQSIHPSIHILVN